MIAQPVGLPKLGIPQPVDKSSIACDELCCQQMLQRLCVGNCAASPLTTLGLPAADARLDDALANEALLQEYLTARERGVSLRAFADETERTNGRKLHYSTLAKWVRRYDGSVASLVSRRRGRCGRPGRLSARQKVEVIAAWAANSWRSRRETHRIIKDRWGKRQAPSYATVNALIKSLRPDVVAYLEGNLKVYNDRFRAKASRLYAHAWHTWQLDEHHLKLLARDPASGKIAAPHLIAMIDCASRAVPAGMILPSKATTSDVLRLIHEAARTKEGSDDPMQGLPRRLQTDNENLFKNESMRTSCERLGVTPAHVHKHCPEENGRIERFWRVVEVEFCAGFESYLRRKLKRKQLAQKAVDLPVLQKRFSEWLRQYNFEREHGVTGQRPVEGFLSDRPRIRQPAVEESVLRRRLCQVEERTYQAYGVTIDGRTYTGVRDDGRIGDKIQVFLPVLPDGSGTVDACFEDGTATMLRANDGADEEHAAAIREGNHRRRAELAEVDRDLKRRDRGNERKALKNLTRCRKAARGARHSDPPADGKGASTAGAALPAPVGSPSTRRAEDAPAPLGPLPVFNAPTPTLRPLQFNLPSPQP